jgi:hypothetical protein
MSIFNEVSGSSKNNSYPYHLYIKSPNELGASTQGNITALKNDLNALFYYVNTLVTGYPKGGSPLGNKYFMNTGATCKDKSGATQSRSIYINNIPDGNIPLISSAMGANLSEFKGLVPGVLGNMAYINPLKLFSAFSQSSSCQKITMETKDISNNTMQESKYVLDDDIAGYSACWFPNRRNPVTNQGCREAMTIPSSTPDDLLFHTYVLGMGLLGVYIMYGLLRKK